MKKGRLSSVSRLIQRPETTEGGNHRLGIEFSYTSTHAALFRSFPRSLAHLFLRVAISSLSGSSCTGAFFGTVTTFVDQTMHTHPRDNRFRFSNVGGQERGNRRGAGRSNSPPCCVFTPGISSKVGFPIAIGILTVRWRGRATSISLGGRRGWGGGRREVRASTKGGRVRPVHGRRCEGPEWAGQRRSRTC